MADLAHDAAFVEDAAVLRPRLERCARVLYPDLDRNRRQADRAVDDALARAYVLPTEGDRTVAAFSALLRPRWRRVRPERRSRAQRIELLDVASPEGADDLGDDLAGLDPISLAIVVLLLLGELQMIQVAHALQESPGRVEELFHAAVERLARLDPDRRDPVVLTRELAALAGAEDRAATARAGVGDLARGRRMQRQSRLRRGVLAVSAAVVVALVATFTVRATPNDQVAGTSSPSATPTSPAPLARGRNYGCDLSDDGCRAQVLMRWRARVSDVMVDHLDPEKKYFSYMTWQISPSEESDAFWHGSGGALGVGLSRSTGGGTEVYLQIATDMEYADACGQHIRRKCRVHQSMDGNIYLVGGDSTSAGGVEVQFVADEDRIITVVARNTSEGRHLQISDADLIELVTDSRLRLPRR